MATPPYLAKTWQVTSVEGKAAENVLTRGMRITVGTVDSTSYASVIEVKRQNGDPVTSWTQDWASPDQCTLWGHIRDYKFVMTAFGKQKIFGVIYTPWNHDEPKTEETEPGTWTADEVDGPWQA